MSTCEICSLPITETVGNGAHENLDGLPVHDACCPCWDEELARAAALARPRVKIETPEGLPFLLGVDDLV